MNAWHGKLLKTSAPPFGIDFGIDFWTFHALEQGLFCFVFPAHEITNMARLNADMNVWHGLVLKQVLGLA